jgi:azurin
MSQTQARHDCASAISTPRRARVFVIIAIVLAMLFIILHLTPPLALAQEKGQRDRLDAEAIGKAAGTKAKTTEDGVVGIRWVRDDVKVTVDKMPLKPFAGLVSVAAFHNGQHGAIIMGDMVVFQDEVTPAMDAAFKNGLEVTALHNHFAFDEPKVYFMHIGGSGAAQKLAAGVKAVWDAVREVRKKNPQPAENLPGKVPDANGPLSAKEIEQILGHKGQTQGGVVIASIGREGQMDGVKVSGSMGLVTSVAFSGSDDYAVVYGDFIMTGAEVQPVVKTLRKHGVHIVALHNHMIGEEPAFYFAHYWGKGAAKELAQAVKAALEAQRNASWAGKR